MNFRRSIYPIMLVLVTCSTMGAQAQSFTTTTDILPGLQNGMIRWADLDNDNDLDLVYCGTNDLSQPFTRVYENVNGSFTARTTAIPALQNGAFAFGDFDRDGDLDVLVCGLINSVMSASLWENGGAFAFTLKYSFPGFVNPTLSWFDIDNDEDLDFLISGADPNSFPNPFERKMFVYENTGAGFTLINNTNLPTCTQCSIDWADANGDGRIDAIITGFSVGPGGNTDLYLNNGDKTFSKDTGPVFMQLYNGDVKWGDFNSDGTMDLVLSGVSSEGKIFTTVYENVGNSLHSRPDIQLQSVGENLANGTAWLDYDNDGNLDLLLTGRGDNVVTVNRVFKLYRGDGNGGFTEVPNSSFNNLMGVSVDIGDYDNDGDVDICYMGLSTTAVVAGIFRNTLLAAPAAANTLPGPPSDGTFSERQPANALILKWGKGTDARTPENGLSYNFYLRNSSAKLALPNSDISSGTIIAQNPSNGHARTVQLKGLPEGDTFWAVQSIDGGKAGSPFSAEKSFFMLHGPDHAKATILDEGHIQLTWVDNSSIETSNSIDRSTSLTTGYSTIANHSANAVGYTDAFTFATDIYYYYRIGAKSSSHLSEYDSAKVLIPTAPTELAAISATASTIVISWKDNSAFENGYVVESKLTSGTVFQPLATLPAGSKTYTHSGLAEGISYDYRVRATNEYGNSAFSNGLSVMTNRKPVGADFSKTILEDHTLSFTIADFTDHFSDPDPGDELVKIVMVTLPTLGQLWSSNVPIVPPNEILKADLANFQFRPDANSNGTATFYCYYNDGKDNSPLRTITLTITPVNEVTGVGESPGRLAVCPNPVTSTLILSPNGPARSQYTVVIRDVLGREVLQRAWSDEQLRIDFSGYAEGLYLVNIKDGPEPVYSGKVLKQ